MRQYRNSIKPIGIFLILSFLFWIFWKALFNEQHPVSQTTTFFPEFHLKEVRAPHAVLTLSDLKGKVSIVHVWATWCGICIKEHQAWMSIKEKWPYDFVSILYRDDPQKVLDLLAARGNPYTYVLNDEKGKLGLDLGLVGTPESFIVDKDGIIRFHHVGALNAHVFETTFLPILKEL